MSACPQAVPDEILEIQKFNPTVRSVFLFFSFSSIIVWLGVDIFFFFFEGRWVGQFIVWGMKFVSRLQVACDFFGGQ